MHDRSRHYGSCCHAVLPWWKRECALNGRKLVSGPAMMSGQVDQGTVKPKDSAAGCTTEPIGTFGYSIECWLHVGGRTGNDAEYLSGRGLLLQSLLRLADQARVLHRDDGLRREVLQQRDLLIGEGAHFLPVDCENPQHSIVFAQRDCYQSTSAAKVDHRTA